jgi:hypothetical protein
MNDILLILVSFQAFIVAMAFLFVLYRLWLGDKYIAAANKLKSQMANIRQNFPELEEKKNKLVASALGDIGIEGIMGELGIDPKLLNNPLVKGLIDKYAPKLIERLSSADKSKSQETGLL